MGKDDARVIRWASGPRTWQAPRWALAAVGTLAPGERPIENDELIRLAPGDHIWRVGETWTHIDPIAGSITVTLHLTEPRTTLP